MRLVVAAALALSAGCRHQGGSPAGRFAVPLTADAPQGTDDAVVATVDGRPIRASDVAVQARAAGSDAKTALAALVDAEVLAGEAARRGLDRDPDAVEAARGAAVRRLLAVTFEKEVTTEKIPERELRNVYNRNINEFDHSLWVDVWQIRVPCTRTAPADEKARARATAEELARRARGIADADAFQALAKQIPAPDKKTYEVDRLMTARDGWTVKEFSYAAFDQLKKPGDTTGVVETEFGYHVIYLNKFVPPVHLKLEEVAPKLRLGVFPDFQRREFAKFVDAQMALHHTVVHYDRIP
ncbi:MAG TPA: peptidylprolyl isomerase [Polyangia bacterium]|nr:peptidylprolyl isomerase [Polyangia bacterium]